MAKAKNKKVDNRNNKRVYLTVGLGFGDETKGGTVDFLVGHYQASLVVRYNGGAQAAHNVMLPNYRHHTFKMLGSGTFAGAQTYLSRFVRVDPFALMSDVEHAMRTKKNSSADRILQNVFIDSRALIVTPYHVAQSQFEAKDRPHCSCAMGVGQSVDFWENNPEAAIYTGDLLNVAQLKRKLKIIEEYYCPALPYSNFFRVKSHAERLNEIADYYHWFASKVQVTDERDWQDMLDTHDVIVFEGAQGVMLDKQHGYQPYITSSNTTLDQAYDLLAGYKGGIESIGLTRIYAHRHGAGPLPTETKELDILPELHNLANEWQGKFRRGWLDLCDLNYAHDMVGKIDYLSISHLDYWDKFREWLLAEKKRDDGNSVYKAFTERDSYIEYIAEQLDIPIKILAYGPRAKDRRLVI